MVLFLTDGLPTVGERSEIKIRESVERANVHARRVFAFGIGFDVNAPLLNAVSRLTRGGNIPSCPRRTSSQKSATCSGAFTARDAVPHAFG